MVIATQAAPTHRRDFPLSARDASGCVSRRRNCVGAITSRACMRPRRTDYTAAPSATHLWERTDFLFSPGIPLT